MEVLVPRTVNLLCLANSYKYRGRCVAGIDLDTGDWIRPVADTAHGELRPEHYSLPGGQAPQMLDVIRIDLDRPQPLPEQPENWLISGTPWSRRLMPPGDLGAVLSSHLDAGPNLFGDTAHRISRRNGKPGRLDASLALIEPEGLQWFMEHSPYNSKRPRAHFVLKDAFYDLPVTDPAWMPAFHKLDCGLHPASACGLWPDEKVLLTLSLAEEFEYDGYCYKLVAGIVAVPRAWFDSVRADPADRFTTTVPSVALGMFPGPASRDAAPCYRNSPPVCAGLG